jgi:hypothetical protein
VYVVLRRAYRFVAETWPALLGCLFWLAFAGSMLYLIFWKF